MKTVEEGLKEAAIEIAPDYPNIETADQIEQLWAIKSTFEGVKAANDDLHKLIDVLRGRLNLSEEDVCEVWDEMKRIELRGEEKMSTRGAITRVTEEGKFEGRYHHNNAYPSGLGAELFSLYRGHFESDLEKMLKALIDEHPAGWSHVSGDWSQEPGFTEDHEKRMHGPKIPACYCHGDRSEEEWLVTQENASGSGCEYVYAFRDNGKPEMLILSSYCENGDKMIGMFGSGDEGATWRVIETVDLSGEEPDWEELEGDEDER